MVETAMQGSEDVSLPAVQSVVNMLWLARTDRATEYRRCNTQHGIHIRTHKQANCALKATTLSSQMFAEHCLTWLAAACHSVHSIGACGDR
jgi:hypothetical protein